MFYGLVFANGDIDYGAAVAAALQQAAPPARRLIIAVDGGLRHTSQLGLQPDILIGDFDSADPEMLAKAEDNAVEIIRLPTHKDETDLEAALLLAAKRGCNPIYVMGVFGGRIDQMLGNLFLAALDDLMRCTLRLVSGKQTVWLARPGDTLVTGQPGDTLSLIPIFDHAVGVETQALEYPLLHETLPFGTTRGISNVMLANEARISFESGLLLIIHTIGKA